MAITKTTRMDAQGRVILPPHIRKELNLNAGHPVTVSLDGGTIKIQPAEGRCVICGDVAHDDGITLCKDKRICKNCGLAIAKALQVSGCGSK